jgi:hypothetical protein
MPRIDDYKQARALAVQKLAAEPFARIQERSGFESPDEGTFRIPFLGRTYFVRYPDFRFEVEGDPDGEVPLQEQVLILHYMMGDPPRKPTGNWIAYREIPGAAFYFSAFVKRAVDPLKKVFGKDTVALKKTARHLEGIEIEAGDAGYQFDVFPGVAVQIILWEGDDEFEAEANILFDASVGACLSPEDAAWAASLLVYRLIGLSKTT